MRNRMEAVARSWIRRSLVLALVASPIAALAGQPEPAHTPLTADEIVRNLEARNLARAAALHHFEGTRTYTLQYRGFPNNHDAEMVVKVTYQSPSTKEFKVVSQSGSKFIIDRVFKRMLESETEAAQEQDRNALSSKNYEFTMAGFESSPDGDRYVLSVVPRTHNKFLYRGKIWVDAADFAVVKIEAEPAQNPSFFIKRTEVQHSYKRVNGFWLPATNRTTSYLRIGGHADLSIDYEQYNITVADPLPALTAAGAIAAPSGAAQ